ncbi:type IV pilus assembly protein FimV, partial [Rhizobacter sp. P5_C2]
MAIAAMCLSATNAWALGLGRLAVQSALGETLRAEIDVTSLTPEEASNLNVRIAPPESYRAAGVDYNQVLPATQVVLQRRPDGRSFLKVTSDRAVQEPFVDVILEITWSTGRLVREYTMLFDPPSTRTLAAAPPATSPALSSSTETAAAAAPASAPRATRPAPVPRPAVTGDAPPAPARNTPRVAAAPSADTGVEAGSGADEYKVKPGDTLSRIAGNTKRPGVSLDQMLASLYQGNPDAFLNNNMNRLKAGAVLAVPSAETAKAITPTEARQLIQAQSADFGAYRQRLASGVAPSKVEGASRQTSGTVQAEVDDRKKAAAPTPDKLTLSKGTASTPEAKVAKEREAKANSSRVAELSKNVEELKKLGQASAGAKAGSPAQAPAPAAVNVPVKPPVVTPPPPPA